VVFRRVAPRNTLAEPPARLCRFRGEGDTSQAVLGLLSIQCTLPETRAAKTEAVAERKADAKARTTRSRASGLDLPLSIIQPAAVLSNGSTVHHLFSYPFGVKQLHSDVVRSMFACAHRR
jgi:hypothetical protein